MHFIKDLFEGNETEHLHNKFIRYSKGNFVGPLAKIKISKKNIKVNASFHYVDELLILLGEFLGNKEVQIKGLLVWNRDLTENLAALGIMYSKVSKARGIFKYTLDNNVKMKEFVDNFKDYNLLVNVKLDDYSYVTKTSFPKPNKEFGPDFVKITFPAKCTKRILEEFCFDVKDIKKDVIIRHDLIIEDIVLPKGEDDFDTIRRLAKRKGSIKRSITVDGEETKSEMKILV